MPVYLRPNELFVKNPNGAGYLPQNVISQTSTAEMLEAFDQTVANTQESLNTMTSAAQQAVDGIEAQKNTMIASIASVAGQGTDTTLTQSGVAADAKTVGDDISGLNSATDLIRGNDIFLRRPNNAKGQLTHNGLTITVYPNHIVVDGTSSSETMFFNASSGYSSASGGFTGYFYSAQGSVPIKRGHAYMNHFRILSGTITRGTATYDKDHQIPIGTSTKVCRTYLMKKDAEKSADWWILSNSGTSIAVIDADEAGSFAFYSYANTTYENAVFELGVIDLDDHTNVSADLYRRNIDLTKTEKDLFFHNTDALRKTFFEEKFGIRYAEFLPGNISTPAVGEAYASYDRNYTSSGVSFESAIIDCEYGDTIVLSIRGGVSPRAYAFVDSNDAVIWSSAEQAEIENRSIEVPPNAVKVVLNNNYALKPNGLAYIAKKDFSDLFTNATLSNVVIEMPHRHQWYYNGITIKTNGILCELDGTATSNVAFLFNELNAYGAKFIMSTTGHSTTFTSLNGQSTVVPGRRYRLIRRLMSGTVTKNGTVYTPETFSNYSGSIHVVNAFLFDYGNANVVLNVDSNEAIIDTDTVGNFDIYIYQGVICDHAVFACYIEDCTDEYEKEQRMSKVEQAISTDSPLIPDYWEENVNLGIERANDAIYSTPSSSSILFVTDCHWAHNEKKSPAIAKKLLNSCNINWFVNGGDFLEKHKTDSKTSAELEIQACINAFYGTRIPMFTVYGNHDRNRNNNADHPETFLEFEEHFNLTNKSFNPNPYIKYVTNKQSYYWEDENYRYVVIYWFSSSSRSLPGIETLMDTTKPVIIICHGIYYTIADDPSQDVIDNGWILGAFEPYKSKIRCFIQGHTHRDALRYAWETVPIISCVCDRTKDGTEGTASEQALSVITIGSQVIKVTRIGRGQDFVVQEGTPIFSGEQIDMSDIEPTIEPGTT